MYKLRVKNEKHRYVLEELVKEFLRPGEYEVVMETDGLDAKTANDETVGSERSRSDRAAEKELRDAEKRRVFDELAELTGYKPEWGTLTGVRPAKLVNELMDGGLDETQIRKIFSSRYYVDDEKIDLLLETCRNQRFITSVPAGRTIGLYLGIPFCPTRCLYCSFASNQASDEAMERYLGALLTETKAVGRRFSALHVRPESVYVGGGTPTSLSAGCLSRLLSKTAESFNLSGVREFCVEAGRPDTITAEKLDVMKRFGVGRISINPQSMNERTLERIGRSHRVSDVYNAFEMARASGIKSVNTDIIAGLPGEDYEMFMNTLNRVMELNPDNITVHTLAVKRASRLKEQNENYHYENAAGVGRMVCDARRILAENGYFPYYMYRQKHMAGNFENVAYAKPGSESVYNIRIMDEHQSIAALGAGGISKAWYPENNRLERVPNVTNFEIYIQRIDEMIERKEKALYKPFE